MADDHLDITQMFRVSLAIMVVVATAKAAAAVELTVPQALNLWEQSIKAIQGYDVYLTVTRRWLAKAEVVGTQKRGPTDLPVIDWRPLGSEKPGEPQVHNWRQVRDARGRRHLEELNVTTGHVETVIAFDGEVKRSLVEKLQQGYLGPGTPRYAQPDEDYVTFYANDYGGASLVEIFRAHESTRLINDPAQGGGVVLDSSPPQGAHSLQHGVRVWLDPEHGMLPSRIEVRRHDRKGEVNLWRRIVISKFTSLANGAWAPVEVLTTSFVDRGSIKGSANQEALAIVDVAKSTWNGPLADSLFTLAFPPGTAVLDDLRRVTFVTGNPQKEANLDRLAEQARDVHPNARFAAEPREAPTDWTRALLISLNGLVVVILALLVVYRYVKRRPSVI